MDGLHGQDAVLDAVGGRGGLETALEAGGADKDPDGVLGSKELGGSHGVKRVMGVKRVVGGCEASDGWFENDCKCLKRMLVTVNAEASVRLDDGFEMIRI